MKLHSQLALAVASLALGFGSIDIKPTSAAIVNYSFTVDSSIKKGNGVFSFDDSTFVSNEALVKSLSFKFDDESNIYTEVNDLNYPDFPIVSLSSFGTGQISLGLNYLFDDRANPSSSIRYEIAGDNFTAFSINSPTLITGTVSYARVPVPEPTTLAGVLLVGSLTFIAHRKKLASKG